MGQVASIIGGGVIGGGWAARFLLMGWDVRVCDPDPQAQRKIGAVLDNARRSLPGLSDVDLPEEGRLSYHDTIAQAVAGAGWIQESVPERLELKHKVYQSIQAHCGPQAVIGSSTSGFKPSQLQDGSARPGQIIVTHPFNPVYLLPLVELVGSDENPPDLIDRAAQTLTGIGMHPLRVRAEIDDAIRYGFGLRWAQMGLFETYRIAGGEAGMRHFIEQFGPCLSWPWTKLMDVPELTEDLIDTIAGQSDVQSGALSIRDLERVRDNNLVAILRGLKAQDWGAGRLLNAQDARVDALPQSLDQVADLAVPVRTVARAVPLDWTDYNGHMNEARYLQAFGDATDKFMALVGCDADYIASGGSYFTAETHIRHLDEVHAGARIQIETQCLLGQGKKMHLFHRMYEGPRLLATGEHMLIHVSLTTRKASEPDARVAGPLARVAQAHAALPLPEGAGKAVGQR